MPFHAGDKSQGSKMYGEDWRAGMGKDSRRIQDSPVASQAESDIPLAFGGGCGTPLKSEKGGLYPRAFKFQPDFPGCRRGVLFMEIDD
jgi:hypothetical protein